MRVSWDVDGFVASLTASSPHTVRAYDRDVRQFVQWAERGGCPDPRRPRPRVAAPLPRVPHDAWLREAHDRPQGRGDPCVPPLPHASRARWPSTLAARCRSPKGPSRLPRVPRVERGRCVARRGRRRAARSPARPTPVPPTVTTTAPSSPIPSPAPSPSGTSPSSRCSTAPACGSPSAAGSIAGDVDLRQRTVTVLGKGSKIRRVPLGAPGRRRRGRLAAGGASGARNARFAPGSGVPEPAGPAARARETPTASWNAIRCPTGGPCTPMPSGTRTLRTCWKAEPTCGPCKSCSVMPIWRRPRSTPISPASVCGPSTNRPILVPDPASTKTDDAQLVAALWNDYGRDSDGRGA